MKKLAKKCAWEDCNADATTLACGRKPFTDRQGAGHPGVASYCTTHGQMVADEGSPEYVEHCPNCGCSFGVN